MRGEFETRPVVYLDLDGVVTPRNTPKAFQSTSPLKAENIDGTHVYVPTIAERLGRIARFAEIAWCTVQPDEDIEKVIQRAPWLRPIRTLPVPDFTRASDEPFERKLEAVFDDQAVHRRPFAWADSSLTLNAQHRVDSLIPVRKMLIAPQEHAGIDEITLQAMSRFVRTQAEAA